MKKQIAEVPATVANVAAAIAEVAKGRIKNDESSARLGKLMVRLFIAHCGSDTDFFGIFGDGKKIAGELRETVVNGIPTNKDGKFRDPVYAKGVLDVLKVRLSEARRLRRDGGMAHEDDNNLQASAKRYKQAKAAAPKTPDGQASAAVVIAPDASMADIAEAVSLWVAKHGNVGAAGLAAALKDCLPITPRRMRKAS